MVRLSSPDRTNTRWHLGGLGYNRFGQREYVVLRLLQMVQHGLLFSHAWLTPSATHTDWSIPKTGLTPPNASEQWSDWLTAPWEMMSKPSIKTNSMREEKPSSLRLTKSSNGCFSIVQVNMIHWTRASRSLDNIPVLMILAVHIYAGFSMSIGSVMSGGLDALDFPGKYFNEWIMFFTLRLLTVWTETACISFKSCLSLTRGESKTIDNTLRRLWIINVPVWRI